MFAPMERAPPRVRLARVPTDVSDEFTTVALRVVPVKVPAGATRVVLETLVISPLPLTVMVGMTELEPKTPTVLFTVARVRMVAPEASPV